MLDHLIARRSAALPLSAVTKADLKAWLAAQSDAVAAWVRAAGFKAEPGAHLLLPAARDGLGGVLLGVESGADIWSYGGLPTALPEGAYRLVDATPAAATAAALGWALGGYV